MLRPTDTGQAGFTFDYWDRMQRAGIKVEESAQTSSSSSSRLSPFSRLSGIPEHTLSRRDTLHRKAISKSASRRNCATRSMPRCSFGDPITNQPIFPNIRSRFSFSKLYGIGRGSETRSNSMTLHFLTIWISKVELLTCP